MLASRGFGPKWVDWIMKLVGLFVLESMIVTLPILNQVKALGRGTPFPPYFSI
jgi:hypothetical protein